MNRWSKDDVDKLKMIFHKTTNKELCNIFQGRTACAIWKKAKKLGLKRDEEIVSKNRSIGRIWTHNKQKNHQGYVLIYKQGHPRADKYGRVFEHIVVWEEANKTSVPNGCVIHHINGIKTDNRVENLQLYTISEHTKYHNKNRVYSEKTKLKMSKKAKERFKDITNHPLYKQVDVKNMVEELRIGNTVKSVCKKFNISKNTFYRRIKKGEI